MKSVTYYSFNDVNTVGLNFNSRESQEAPLMVNCCGRTHIIYPFTTYNGIGRDDYYLMYLREGKLKTLIGDVECIATPGDFIIFPPHYKYKYTFAAGNSLVYYFVHFTGSEAERYLKKLFGDNFPCLLHAGDSDAAIDSFSRMFDAYGKDVEICDTVSAAELSNVLLSLMRANRLGEKPSPLSRSISYMRASYTEEIRIPELAAMEGLSVSRYNTVFKQIKGISPVQYITELRMQHACSLLTSTDLSVKKIGEMVGYSDNHFFSKIFKSRFGVSPKEYRSNS